MTKDEVIKLRTALKGGYNLPLRIFIDNSFAIIDESLVLNFTKWDDSNGFLYVFRLLNPQQSTNPSDIASSIQCFATSYEMIQAMETVQLPLNSIDSVFGTMEASGMSIPNQENWNKLKDNMKYAFAEALGMKPDLTHRELNAMHGSKYATNDKDEYFEGRFTESFKETRDKVEYNEYIKKKNEQTS